MGLEPCVAAMKGRLSVFAKGGCEPPQPDKKGVPPRGPFLSRREAPVNEPTGSQPSEIKQSNKSLASVNAEQNEAVDSPRNR